MPVKSLGSLGPFHPLKHVNRLPERFSETALSSAKAVLSFYVEKLNKRSLRYFDERVLLDHFLRAWSVATPQNVIEWQPCSVQRSTRQPKISYCTF